MSKNLHDEFEEYVKKLTVEISKEIFLEQLKKLYVSYDNNLKNTMAFSANLNHAVQDLSEGVQKAGSTVLQVQQDSKSSLNAIELQIRQVETHTEELFANIRKLDEDDRQALLNDLAVFSMQHTDTIRAIMKDSCNNIDSKLKQIITAEQLQQFRTALEQNTQSSQQLADYVNNVLTGETDNGLERIHKAMEGAVTEQLAMIDKMVKQTLEKGEKEFTDVINAAGDNLIEQLRVWLKNQKTEWDDLFTEHARLVEQLSPKKKEVEQLVSSGLEIKLTAKQQQNELQRGITQLNYINDRIQNLENSVQSFINRSQSNDTRLYTVVEEQKRQLQQEEENLKTLKLFVLCSSTLTLILLVLLIFSQPPSLLWGIALIASAFIVWCVISKK